MTSEEKEDLVREVRQTYYLERKLFEIRQTGDDIGQLDSNKRNVQWDGGTDARGVKHTSVWRRIVDYATKHSIPPVDLVKAVFAAQVGSKPPIPSMFTGAYAIECYGRLAAQVDRDDLKLQFDIFRRSARVEAWKLSKTVKSTPERIWRLVITSPLLNCGGLFRYCLAHNTNNPDLAAGYRQSAIQEYLSSPDDYDAVLAKYIPDDFRTEARGSRDILMTR